ncbi:bifunctional diguanylate cyclase/phosphodiesterase [Thaumasiovibrio subtropicus]|uniref:bifunctional diguanylate cyclase/phosphodiesterase n=1 Tax=Thaumasiovibrio subtropicus TaxID=1891207 RepID=UPI000B362159|nr:cache domain-containing protein [Thaumasiovibrio subtropicus]
MMQTLNDQKLLRLIRYAPVVIIGVVTLVISLVLIKGNQARSEARLEALRSEVIEIQKETIRQHVNRVIQEIDYHRALAEGQLKRQAKMRVDEAHAIATNIYSQNAHLPEDVVTEMIADALRPIRFFDGRGYFFVFKMDGINVIHGLKPEIEGNSGWEAKDSRGTSILQEHIRLIAESGEAFYRWWYSKPGYPKDQEFEKIGYGKYFAPYDWFIGTGEYVDDVESDIQQHLLDWVTSYQYGDDGYVFVLDEEGKLLAHPHREYLSQPLSLIQFGGGQDIWERFQAAAPQGGFVEYQLIFTDDRQKLSYIAQIEEWGWTIGTGFYLDDFERYLDVKREEVAMLQRQEWMRLTLAIGSLAFAMIAFSLLLSMQVSRRFGRFQEKIAAHFNQLVQTRDQLQQIAQKDVLTNLPNRLMLTETIQQGIEEGREKGLHLAVVFVDLDNFKRINDIFGHSTGDELLVAVSERFDFLLEDDDLVARFGGDEFVFCFPNLKSFQAAERKIRRIKRVFDTPFKVGGRLVTTGCSVGASMFPADSDSAEVLIRNADIVLYKSKAAQRKGEVFFYSAAINEEVQYAFQMQEQLKQAIERNELFVLYQPQVDAAANEIVGVEVLARWENSKLGFVPPDKFISAAEEAGIIHQIGMWVFRRACEDVLSISPNGENALKLSVNISPAQLNEAEFATDMLAVINEVGIDIDRLVLEITENILIHDLTEVAPMLHSLRHLGFGISLDDFGTGYSSLSYLNTLPITEIKIDRCFVDKLLVSDQSDSLIKAILAIGAASDFSVVAEGVETKSQYVKLKSYGCHFVQGFYFDKPLSLELLQARLEKTVSYPAL